MKLEVGHIFINDIQFASESKIENGVLYVDEEAVKAIVLEDEKIKDVKFDIAKPGESVRITPVKDVIEPRVKVEGRGGVFPGVIAKVDTVGSGKTYALKGMAVVTAGKIVGFQEGIIDMSGPGAEYTPFSKLNNLVVVCEPVEGIKQHEYEKAVRLAGFRVAVYLGELARELTLMKQKFMKHTESWKEKKNSRTFRELLMYRCFRARDFSMTHMYTVLMLREHSLQS